MKALMEVWHQPEEIREATNGAEAVQMLDEYQPDIILMDARMPSMGGLEATRLIKARRPQIKIVILSLYSDYQASALAAGADAFVSKSDSPEVLRRAIARILEDKNNSRGGYGN